MGSCLWYLIRAKPRQDARAETNLRSWGIETLAPKVRNRGGSRIRRRTLIAHAEAPLFPGYIFAKFDAIEQLQKVRLTRGVQSIVGFGEPATPVDEAVIEVVMRRMDQNGFVGLEGLRPGDTVKIISGPLSPLEGLFERQRAQERVVILLEHVLSRVRVEVAKADVAKLASTF